MNKKTVRWRVDESGCWIWLLHISTVTGYGQGWNPTKQKVESAHVINYEAKYGPIPEGKELDHLCRVRACCNPDHVEPVTRIENAIRGAKPKIDSMQATEIRAKFFRGGYSKAALGREYYLSAENIRRILNRTRWGWVNDGFPVHSLPPDRKKESQLCQNQ